MIRASASAERGTATATPAETDDFDENEHFPASLLCTEEILPALDGYERAEKSPENTSALNEFLMGVATRGQTDVMVLLSPSIDASTRMLEAESDAAFDRNVKLFARGVAAARAACQGFKTSKALGRRLEQSE